MDVQQSSPFDLPPDLEGQKNALTMALQIVQDFALYIVVSEPSRARPRLMREMEARLVGKTIQHIFVPKRTENLLHLLADNLTNPLPDIVFVYGLENSISASAEPRSHPLLLNLNATRNNFYALLPRPMVLWVPAFVLKAIVEAAPDFISVRSSVYTFPLDSDEQRDMADTATTIGQSGILSVDQAERENYILAIQHLLEEHRSLSEQERNAQDETQILNQLALAYCALGIYNEAEALYKEVLEIDRQSLPEGHPNIAQSLNNLAALYEKQGRYDEAELLLVEALKIYRKNVSEGHGGNASSLNNMAVVYIHKKNYTEAEALLTEALAIDRQIFPARHPNIAPNLNNLAELYRQQGRYTEAEPLYNEALKIRRQALPKVHTDTAQSLNNLALLYQAQGRYAEAEPLLTESLAINQQLLPEGHLNIAQSLNNLAALYEKQGRYQEAKISYSKALKFVRAKLGNNHPRTQLVARNLNALLVKQIAHTASEQRFKLPASLAKQSQRRLRRPK